MYQMKQIARNQSGSSSEGRMLSGGMSMMQSGRVSVRWGGKFG